MSIPTSNHPIIHAVQRLHKMWGRVDCSLFQAFFSTYVPEKASSVCIKDSVFIDSAEVGGSVLTGKAV